MAQFTNIQVPVEQATADALRDEMRLSAVGYLVDRLVRPGEHDPLAAVFEATRAAARDAGITDADIDAELAAYNAERRG